MIASVKLEKDEKMVVVRAVVFYFSVCLLLVCALYSFFFIRSESDDPVGEGQ